MTIAEFERVVLNQQPATEPWQPVTDYSFDARKAIEGDHPCLIKEVFAPTIVLDAGCGPDGILVKLLTDEGVTALGFDPQIASRSLNRRLIRASILDDPGDQSPADVVVCREVLEHFTVRQIRVAISHLCRLTQRFVYVTTRFSSESDVFQVDTADELDPTHISLCAKDFIRLLFVLEGFKARFDLEERLDWQRKGRCLVYERA